MPPKKPGHSSQHERLQKRIKNAEAAALREVERLQQVARDELKLRGHLRLVRSCRGQCARAAAAR